MVNNPFESIESAYDFLRLLDAMLEEVQKTSADGLEAELVDAQDAARRAEALRLVDYKLAQLRHHVSASSRILNDLRTMRRLLLRERNASGLRPALPIH